MTRPKPTKCTLELLTVWLSVIGLASLLIVFMFYPAITEHVTLERSA